jgi:hypothetical protein
MERKELETLLKKVKKGEVSIKEALEKLAYLPFIDVGFAKIDTHRHFRKKLPESIYCPGKSREKIKAIAKELQAKKISFLATKADEESYKAIKEVAKEAKYFPEAKLVWVGKKKRKKGLVAVITAGTSDIPVAEEAALTAEFMGSNVERFYDIGVAGSHRIFPFLKEIRKAKSIVVVAGMEGALPSLIAGVVSSPVIGVPTSVGYGASFGGITPLLAMLNSCAEGLSVVNIDNGFGAGYLASLINLQSVP